MRIIDRYLIRGVIYSVVYCWVAFICFYILIDLSGNLDDLLEERVAFKVVLDYYLNLAPLILVQVSPIALLLAVLYKFGDLSKYNELTAMKAGGMSLYRLIAPLLLLALILSLLMILVNESAVPRAARKAYELKRERMGRDRYIWEEIAYRGLKGREYSIKLLNTKDNLMKNITITEYRDGDIMASRIDAEEARWKDGEWILYSVVIREFLPGGKISFEEFEEMRMDIEETPEDFSQRQPKPEEMSFGELRCYIGKLRERGHTPRAELVNLHSKISHPFINLVILLLGIPFSLHLRRGGMVIGFGIAVGIGFLFHLATHIGSALGKDILPPVVGAWLPNILFGGIGLALLHRAKK